jgi:hypothetical protein
MAELACENTGEKRESYLKRIFNKIIDLNDSTNHTNMPF